MISYFIFSWPNCKRQCTQKQGEMQKMSGWRLRLDGIRSGPRQVVKESGLVEEVVTQEANSRNNIIIPSFEWKYFSVSTHNKHVIHYSTISLTDILHPFDFKYKMLYVFFHLGEHRMPQTMENNQTCTIQEAVH